MLILRTIARRTGRTTQRSSCVLGIGKLRVYFRGCFRSPNLICDRYDFDLATGKSETGLQACVYEVRVRQPETDGEAEVWIEAPQGGTGWQLVNIRPVSEGGSVSRGLLRKANTPPPPQSSPTPLRARLARSLRRTSILHMNPSTPQQH